MIFIAHAFELNHCRKCLMAFVILFSCFTLFCGLVRVDTFKDFVSDPRKVYQEYKFLLGVILYVMMFKIIMVAFFQRVNFVHIDDLHLKLKNKQEHKQILNRLENSIIIVDDH